LFYLAERVFHLDRAHAQTMMYLKLSVAGHLTIFLTRTRGPFWSIKPAKILWIAVLGTQIIATLIAVYGLFMTPLGWGWAAFVWGYALVWFLINDRVKLLAYRFFDRTMAGATPEARAEAQIHAKAEQETAAKADAKIEVKPAAKARISPDLTPQISERAYQLYEKRGRQSDHAVEDWEQAKREIGKEEAKTKPQTQATAPPQGRS
jgi:H+-transporting ATPase